MDNRRKRCGGGGCCGCRAAS